MELYIHSAAFPSEVPYTAGKKQFTDLDLHFMVAGPPSENFKQLEMEFYTLLRDRREYTLDQVLDFLRSGHPIGWKDKLLEDQGDIIPYEQWVARQYE